MLSIIITWSALFLSSYITGFALLKILYRENTSEAAGSEQKVPGIDECIFAGTVVLTVYAQFFSIFFRVGTKALLGLVLIIMICLVYSLIKYRTHALFNVSRMSKISCLQWGISLLLLLAMISWVNTVPQNYDTYLYHFQSIQWLERYGVITGLGNLHCRFAYNSAFLPLQALFSFRGIIGQSLHTVNGFYTMAVLVYCTTTNSILKKESLRLSDYIKLAAIGYICFVISLVSSPGTDTLALTLFLYICIKWSEYTEAQVNTRGSQITYEANNKYAWLCMLTVYDVTLKLSVATAVLLAVYPIINYIKLKKGKDVVKHVITGIIIACPWLIRNVIISGYLVYPYTQIDLFDVDWKIPGSVALDDSYNIQIRSKGFYDMSQKDQPIWYWFPGKWFEKYPGFFERFIVVAGIILFIALLIYMIVSLYKRNANAALSVFYSVVLISFYVWFTTAPTVRYGAVFSFVLIAIWLDILFRIKDGRISKAFRAISVLVYVYIAFNLIHVCGEWKKIYDQPVYLQCDYDSINTRPMHYGEYDVWVPTGDSDLCGTNVFPSLPYPKMLDLLEMRGGTVKEGFRVREEYKDQNILMNGDIL